MTITVTPLAETFAAEVRGVDLRNPLSSADVADIQAAFDEHGIIVLPDQIIDDDQQITYSRNFGELETSIRFNRDGGSTRPELSYIGNVDKNGDLYPIGDERGLPGTERWHSDSSFRTVPAYASLLSARIVPPTGGETEFADLRGAWDALPADMQNRAKGQTVIHDLIKSRKVSTDQNVGESEQKRLPPVRQALVRPHPKNGRKAIYIGAHAIEIEGWPEDESRAFLDTLTEHATQPKFVYRHKWRKGDLVMWDNTRAVHRRCAWDSANHARVMIRTTVAGAGPTT
ncbi:MAG: alpha-ketoglutarate-dependent 2,4-dichlorophenoxyacetate dioxygenase [Alphaproteobacteria bacterium]|jgi:alpha-ketoglutarate-dependent 2,4-dichlorophenoxyacetate dioxygenase